MRIFFRPPLFLLVSVWLCATAFAAAAFADTFRPLTGQAFDGQAINLNGAAPQEADAGLESEVVVGLIMRHAGLPRNFTLYTHPQVANAAAVILVDKESRGKRALICNQQFMQTARQAMSEGNWAPLSIIVHEIGHHVAGHPLVADAWLPGDELAADAFSGFILYKLGAKLGEAGRAVNTLALKKDQAPSRENRLQAVRQGWMFACRQQSDHCGGDEAAVLLPTPASVDQGEIKTKTPAKKPDAPTAPAVLSPVASGPADVLPVPDPQATPVKFGHYVVDELDVLDRAARASFERRMFDVTAKNQVEIVTIISQDLRGMTADEYAQTMLRQLAVGSEETANGAVLLVAPHEKQVGMALAPGLVAALGDKATMARERLKNFEEFSLLTCQGNCRAEQTAMLFHAAAFIADVAEDWDFSVSYPKNGALATNEATTAAGLVCLRGTFIGRDGAARVIPLAANTAREMALKVVDSAGREISLSIHPDVEKTARTPLNIGASYQFIVRELPPAGPTRRFEALSYAALP
ncbi:MAG: TPM domain-containing protein [Desulfobulbaceae bacterium]|nr:TPM domain-containing protein [Desulfobulbaceae bacterium]